MKLRDHLHIYGFSLMRPGRVHDWLRRGVPLWEGAELPRPGLTEFLGMSWAMAVVQGMSKLLLANLLIQAFLSFQNEGGAFFSLVETQDGLWPYYVLVFSTALDIVFFPILTLVITGFWNFVIRIFGGFLGLEEDREERAEQITTVALSSHAFLLLPVLGPFLQKIAWFFLAYVGLRRNLGASRSLSVVILLTPTVVSAMFISLVALAVFYLSKS